MRWGWITDVHLNFVSPPKRAELYARLRGAKLNGLRRGGDVGEADSGRAFPAEKKSKKKT